MPFIRSLQLWCWLPHLSYHSWFAVCWRLGAVKLEWCLGCRLKPAKENILHTEHGESLKSRILHLCGEETTRHIRLWRWNWQRVLKRRLLALWHRGTTQKKTYYINYPLFFKSISLCLLLQLHSTWTLSQNKFTSFILYYRNSNTCTCIHMLEHKNTNYNLPGN